MTDYRDQNLKSGGPKMVFDEHDERVRDGFEAY